MRGVTRAKLQLMHAIAVAVSYQRLDKKPPNRGETQMGPRHQKVQGGLL